MGNTTSQTVGNAIQKARAFYLGLIAKAQVMVNLTIPMRVYFAHDQAVYAMACDEEACSHYHVPTTTVGQVRSYALGFIQGLTCETVPDWFVERWFQSELALT